MLPELFLKRMETLLGAEYEAFIEGFQGERYRSLRLNPLKVRREDYEQNSPFTLEQVPWEPWGYYYEDGDTPGKHPHHEAGVYYIQEPSAMAPVTFLDVKPGDTVLDLCAAPGGKSTQIAGKLMGEGMLICNEIHPARAKILSENIERMGVTNALVTNETPAHLAQLFPGFFDRILVDAPCSGEGMFRKNENAGEEWSPENVQLCALRQREILDLAAEMLKPGGRLVYSTCTFAPDENEGSVSAFLAEHKEFRPVTLPANPFAPGRGDWIEDPAAGIENTCRLWPHKIKGEGHFLAVLEKEGTLDPTPVSGLYGFEKGLGKKDLQPLEQFCKENRLPMPQGVFLRFGDQIYVAMENCPALKKLTVLRPGLHLGTLKKDRFEPSHSWALSLKKEEVTYVWNLTAAQAAEYINGQTFPAEGEKGWYLICVDGYSLGWGKLAGGMMKNHYPKGLRK